jgi:hypothetical protein
VKGSIGLDTLYEHTRRAATSKRAVRYARRYPGKTATEIAHAIKADPASVSSALNKAARAGLLTRTRRVKWVPFNNPRIAYGITPPGAPWTYSRVRP